MSSLKEIRTRIQSVQSTRKITSAMMMISSSKLVKAENTLKTLSPYEEKLQHILDLFLSSVNKVESPYTINRKVSKLAIVAYSSNSGLAGRFNSNVAERLQKVVSKNIELEKENITIYPIGEQIRKAVHKMGFEPAGDFRESSTSPTYQQSKELAEMFMQQFTEKKVDKVILIYHHLKSKNSLKLKEVKFLPIKIEPVNELEEVQELDYIIEPDAQTVLDQLIPKILKLKLYTAHSDSTASEHAARTIAMQIATDNADDLLDELKLQFNKLRQQSITNELLDIIGGSLGGQR